MRHSGGFPRDVPQPSLDSDPMPTVDAPWRRLLVLLGFTMMAIGVLLGLGINVHAAGAAGDVSCGPAWTGVADSSGAESSPAGTDEAECAAERQARGGTAVILLVLGGGMTAIAVSGRRSVAAARV